MLHVRVLGPLAVNIDGRPSQLPKTKRGRLLLAWLAVRQLRSGRRVGTHINVNDLMSPYGDRRRNVAVQSLWTESKRYEPKMGDDERQSLLSDWRRALQRSGRWVIAE